MKILAIETSCDDTGVAVLEAKGKKSPRFCILSNVVSSQVKLHAKYGGVYPALAKREHQRNLVPVLEKALKETGLLISSERHSELVEESHSAEPAREMSRLRPAGFARHDKKVLNSVLEREPELLKKTIAFLKKYQKPDIDLIAVTHGPGLEPCLWAGVNFAKALATAWNLPIVPVNHIEAHILANFINKDTCHSERSSSDLSRRNEVEESHMIKFPAIALVVSGGHTQLVLIKRFGQYKIIGETRDDAAGECFDKTARILGLNYPGGPAIAEQAAKHIANRQSPACRRGRPIVKLPRPMIKHKNYDFSFSGLKTAVLYDFKKRAPKTQTSQKYIQAMCYEIQQAVIDVLIAKTIKAAKDFRAKSIILGGGVTANRELREQFKQKIKKELPASPTGVASHRTRFYIPDSKLSTDNAAMVAVAGSSAWLKKKTKNSAKIKAEGNLRIGY